MGKRDQPSAQVSLVGETPERMRVEHKTNPVTEAQIRKTRQHFLSKKKVTICCTLVDFNTAPCVEYDGQIYTLVGATPLANGRPRPC